MKINLARVRRFIYSWISFSICVLFFYANAIAVTPIPLSCRQVILVVTDSITATKGTLYYFNRDFTNDDWRSVNDKTPIVLGRNGLGWGIGLHDEQNISHFPIKEEGDGRSPAGIFRLSSVFGYASADQLRDLKMPYLHITEMTECIDDVTSQYYNQIISRAKIEGAAHIDWESSEKMRLAGIYYELGVVVEHNRNPIRNGSGSCIFLHNWSNPDETMAGCTAMDPAKMEEIVYWLDETQNPILVQLTKQLYIDLIKQWELPDIPGNALTK